MKKRVDVAEIRWKKVVTKFEAKVKLREANEIQKEHNEKIKKKKEDEMLDFQDNKFNEEDEKYMKNKERMLKSLKKIIRRNSDLRRLKFLLLIRRKDLIGQKKFGQQPKKVRLETRGFCPYFWEVDHPLWDV